MMAENVTAQARPIGSEDGQMNRASMDRRRLEMDQSSDLELGALPTTDDALFKSSLGLTLLPRTVYFPSSDAFSVQ